MEHYSSTNHANNKVWVSADNLIRAISESQDDYEFTYGITGKYTKFIQQRDEALRKELEMKAKKSAKTSGQNSEEEELVC